MDVSDMFNLVTKDKIECSFFIYILLHFHLSVAVHAYYLWVTRKSVLKILAVDNIDWWDFVRVIVSIGLALVVSIATIFFMVALLLDLQKDDTSLTIMYLMYSSNVISVTVLLIIGTEYTIDVRSITAKNIIPLLVLAIFPYMISNHYWANLPENSHLYLAA